MTEQRLRKHVKGRRGEEFREKIKGLKAGEIIGIAIDVSKSFYRVIIFNWGIPLSGVTTTYCGFPASLPRHPGQAHHTFWALWQLPAGGAGRTVSRESGRFDD